MAESEPAPRLIRSAREAEEVVCTWLRYWGHDDASLTGYGADAGIDVQGKKVVAQVKAEARPVGRPVVQSLGGVAAAEGKLGAFFALGGYTAEALSWATRAGIAAFAFDLSGKPEPLNDQAQALAADATGAAEHRWAKPVFRPLETSEAEPLGGPWAQPLPEQDLYAAPLRPGDRADPRRLASTILQMCLIDGLTIAGRDGGLWTPHHRYLWSVEAMESDGEISGQLEVFYLAVPQWRDGQLPEPVPHRFRHHSTSAVPDEHEVFAYLSDEIANAWRQWEEISCEGLASILSLTVSYEGPLQAGIVQLVADLSSILLTLGRDLRATTIEVRDFEAEAEVADRLSRDSEQLARRIEAALETHD